MTGKSWIILILFVSAFSGCEHREVVKIVIKNDSSSQIRDAHLWLSKGEDLKTFRAISARDSASVTIGLPDENNLSFEFRGEAGDLRQFHIIPAFARLDPLLITVDQKGSCWYERLEDGRSVPCRMQ